MVDIHFKRLGTVNANGSVPGEMVIGNRKWPTIERGVSYTFVRRGDYELLMTHKASGRRVKCLCFHEDPAISSHLIHDALNDNHVWLAGCIAPGLTSNANGIAGSAEAMKQVFEALGGFAEGRKKTIRVENNIRSSESKQEWIARRIREGK